MLVFEDANLDRAAAGAVWGALTNTGQSCTSVERLYVQESIFEAFRAKLLAQVERLRTGESPGAWVDLGPMVNDLQTAVGARQVGAARDAGARLLTGASWDGKSRLIPPIVIDRPDSTLEVCREETFGPVLPLFTFRSEEEAVRLANDSPYGLSASVWSADLRRAERVARNLVTGNVSINNVMVMSPMRPMRIRRPLIAQLAGAIIHSGPITFRAGPAGKTLLARGVAQGADVPLDEVTSPSYSIIQSYRGRLTLHYADLYRLQGEDELYATGYFDLLESEGAWLVEWWARCPGCRPRAPSASRWSGAIPSSQMASVTRIARTRARVTAPTSGSGRPSRKVRNSAKQRSESVSPLSSGRRRGWISSNLRSVPLCMKAQPLAKKGWVLASTTAPTDARRMWARSAVVVVYSLLTQAICTRLPEPFARRARTGPGLATPTRRPVATPAQSAPRPRSACRPRRRRDDRGSLGSRSLRKTQTRTRGGPAVREPGRSPHVESGRGKAGPPLPPARTHVWAFAHGSQERFPRQMSHANRSGSGGVQSWQRSASLVAGEPA